MALCPRSVSAGPCWPRWSSRHLDFAGALHSPPPIPAMPHTALGASTEPNWSDLWCRDRSLDLDVLPVLSDLKFRLQHNALNLRSKYQWRPVDVGYVHVCPAVETPRHLFWDCPYAQRLWSLFLPPLQLKTERPIRWEAAVYLTDIGLTPASSRDTGQHNILRVLNIVRCCVFRSSWLHRNERVFHLPPHLALQASVA
ncbi:unnamed protein product [Peronospora destructor]|uniref:Reverse transcriptase zinc-binding domain-containing protein n=1 Tax=Peronospora destructor TaxID=86335 RepID=A0AAV0T2Q0_9STRA|nr:unnamed protein product [Peronospora destructor]